jgi:hypothetical protein
MSDVRSMRSLEANESCGVMKREQGGADAIGNASWEKSLANSIHIQSFCTSSLIIHHSSLCTYP